MRTHKGRLIPSLLFSPSPHLPLTDVASKHLSTSIRSPHFRLFHPPPPKKSGQEKLFLSRARVRRGFWVGERAKGGGGKSFSTSPPSRPSESMTAADGPPVPRQHLIWCEQEKTEEWGGDHSNDFRMGCGERKRDPDPLPPFQFSC